MTTTITDPAELAPTCSQCGDALGDIAAECVDCSALFCSADCEDTHACLPQSAPSAPQTDEQAQTRGDSHTKPQTGSQGPLDGCAHAAAADATGRPPRASEITLADVMDRIDVTAAELRSHLAEARQQRDQAAEALVAAQTEGDEAWDRLSTLVDELASALEMSGTPDDHEIIREARAFGQLRVELAALRAEREWLADRARTMGIAEAIIATYGPAHAISAAVGRLRTEVKQLSARVREWEAVNADLAKRCDSGDIPTRLGERYSQAVLREIDRLRAEDLAIRRLLRDYGASVGGVDPLPAIVAEILDAVRKTGAELVELRDRHEQVCEELAEARRGCDRLRAERDQARSDVCGAAAEADDARRDFYNLRDGLVDALEMGHAPDDDDIISEARTAHAARQDLARLRTGALALADRIHTLAMSYIGPLGILGDDLAGIAEELRTLTAGSTPDTDGWGAEYASAVPTTQPEGESNG